MKHLKTFEELDKDTYMSAADKLDAYQHHKRAKNIRKHAHKFTDNQPFFTLGDGTQYVDNIPRYKDDMRFVDCVIKKPLLSKNITVEFIFDDNGKKRYLSLSKKKGSESNFSLKKWSSAFDEKSINSICFFDRTEALKFIDFINQSDMCRDLDEEGLLDDITVNSVFLPEK